MFLPGESQGQGSLKGCRLWGHTESDTTDETKQQQQQTLYTNGIKQYLPASTIYWNVILRLIYDLQRDCAFFLPLMLYSMFSLVTYFILSSVDMLIQISQFTIPLLSTLSVPIVFFPLCLCLSFCFTNKFICTIF